MLLRTVSALITALLLCAAAPLAQATELVMVRADWCAVCERWEDEVGVVYDKTSEARIAPLRRVEYGGAELEMMELKEPVSFTPTFILVRNDVEIARINGYIADHFFWGELSQLLERYSDTPAKAEPAEKS